MASSLKKPTKGRGGSSSSKGGSSIAGGARMPRDPGDNGSSSDSVLGSPKSHGDILGRPTVDPWYRSGERFPSIPGEPPTTTTGLGMAVFDFQCSRAIEWADWIDLELADRGFCDRLEQAGVLRSILVSRCSNMYRDTEALRQLVRRWCPSTHTFFFAHGELTVTLEDVENHWLLPILGDQDPADLVLSPEELEIEAALADYIGRRNVALGTQAARFKPWMEHFNRETKPSIRRAAFVAYWLSKCVFGEHPAYSIKPLYFPLAVKVAAGVCFPLAPLLLGQIYTQLDLLHAEELAGGSCHIVTTAFNSSIVHTFLWEHALEYIRKGRKPYEARNKFASMPEGVVANVGDFQGDVPAVYRWVGSKFYDHSLIPSLDSESKVCWRPYGVSHRGFMYESVMFGFSNIEAQDYSLIAGDTASLAYLSATNAGWLPVLSSDGLRFTVYSAHRVRKQFGFDQEVPAVMGVAAGEIPIINPFLRTMAFAYWSGVAPRVIVPSGDRVGIYTTAMSNYWRGLMAAMVEFRNSGKGDVSHLLESYTSPLPHPRLFTATNTMTTYANLQSLGYVVWHHEESQWVLHGSPHPPLWLRDHLHVAAPGKVPSSRGRRTASAGISAVKRKQPDRSKKGEATRKDSPAQASKRIKTVAGKVSKEVLALKTAVQDPLPTDETAAQGVSAPVSKKPVRKTRVGKKTFVPPAFPSAPASIAARVAARKSGRGIVYSEKRSKQRADTAARIPIEIPDDLSSSSPSSDKNDPSGAAAKEIESGDTETAAAEETENEDTEAVAAEEIESEDTEAAAAETVSGAITKSLRSRTSDRGFHGTASGPANPNWCCRRSYTEEHGTVGVVTGAEKVIESHTSIAITSSGGTVQGGPSGRKWQPYVDPSLLDSSPSLPAQYVRRARRGSLVSSDSERTASALARVATPPSPPPKSGGTVPLSTITVAGVSAAATVPESGIVPTTIEETPVGEEGSAHVSDVPEAELFPQLIEETPGLRSDGMCEGSAHVSDVPEGVTQVEHVEVAASEEPVQADVTPGSGGVPVIEEELAQGPADDIDMGDTHDSYEEVLAETEDNMVGAQAADIEVTAPAAAHTSSTKTAGSGNETVVEEEGRLQTAAVESAIRGQPGLLSATRPATLGSSVLADMDAFFREFDRTSFSSRHAEHFWTFDDVKADFEVFRVPRGGIRFLKALWSKYGSCSSYFSRGVHVGSSLLTLRCCVLAHMEHTRLEDITEVHILEWKAVVQEAIEGGFKFGFILDYLRRLAHDMFSRRVLAELRVAEARVAALRAALNTVAPNPWDLASARRASAEARAESALQNLLS
uniref:Aminotransferase-like plant mobile domain-containing protein n=1 Tax=Fagus sylvatica TaxID=28930 RepID=A0A2N9GS51_FAGSY